MDSHSLGRILRTLFLCLAALCLVVGFSACGSSGGAETVTVSDSSDTETDTTETDTTETDTEATDTETVESDTESSDTAADTSDEDEVNAKAAVDALLLGVRGEDPNIICGLLSEEYANKLTGEAKFGIAKCVENLEKADLGSVKTELNGVEVEDTVVDSGGDTATVTLTNSEEVKLKKDPKDQSRYVITAGLE
ncbi:MAG: hypothetical protein WKF32_03585 [Thermoleophilaceae bacterium]